MIHKQRMCWLKWNLSPSTVSEYSFTHREAEDLVYFTNGFKNENDRTLANHILFYQILKCPQ